MFRAKSQVVALTAGFLGVCGMSVTATADGYRRPVAAMAPFSWTGFYIGGNGGYAWSNDQTVRVDETFQDLGVAPVPFLSANFGSLAPAGGFGGAQVGANLQLGAVVLGAEADGQWADISDESAATVVVPSGTSPYTIGTSNLVQRFGTVRARLGVAWDRTLVYGTAGLAWGRVSHTLIFEDAGGFTALGHQAGTQVGYAVGCGVEHMLTPRLSLKVEYQYIDLGSEDYVVRERATGAGTAFFLNTTTETDFHTVRLGLNYKLGSPHEPVPYK